MTLSIIFTMLHVKDYLTVHDSDYSMV